MERITNISYSDNTLTFDFLGQPREANVLRRIFLRDIPTMAIDSIQIRKNTTVTNDEYLSHRLQLIPIMVDADSVSDKENIVLTLKSMDKLVMSNDIKGKFKAMPDIIITKVNDTQQLELEARVTKGTAKEHVRWSAVTIATFRYDNPEIIHFTVESIGVYSPEQLLKKAIQIYFAK